MVSDAFPKVCPTHSRTQPDASKMQHFQQTKRVDILKPIQMHSLSVMHSDASKMQHFRVSQRFLIQKRLLTLVVIACVETRLKINKNYSKTSLSTLLSIHFYRYMTFLFQSKQPDNLFNGLQQTRFDHGTYCIDNIALTVKPYTFVQSYLDYRVALDTR